MLGQLLLEIMYEVHRAGGNEVVLDFQFHRSQPS
jgi:hypothetical protein